MNVCCIARSSVSFRVTLFFASRISDYLVPHYQRSLAGQVKAMTAQCLRRLTGNEPLSQFYWYPTALTLVNGFRQSVLNLLVYDSAQVIGVRYQPDIIIYYFCYYSCYFSFRIDRFDKHGRLIEKRSITVTYDFSAQYMFLIEKSI